MIFSSIAAINALFFVGCESQTSLIPTETKSAFVEAVSLGTSGLAREMLHLNRSGTVTLPHSVPETARTLRGWLYGRATYFCSRNRFTGELLHKIVRTIKKCKGA